jgi:MFS family permease
MKRTQVPKNLILAVVGIAQLMDILDMAIVNVALPSISRDLRIGSLTSLQWVTSGYVLAYGGFLILGGRAADLFGRKRVFVAATSAFALASLATGAAQSSAMMDVARGLQGLSAAFMSPAALSIVLTTFTDKRERNRALGIWGAIGASGAVIGAVLGGLITTYLGWRWNFFINIFIGAVVVAAALRLVPADPPVPPEPAGLFAAGDRPGVPANGGHGRCRRGAGFAAGEPGWLQVADGRRVAHRGGRPDAAGRDAARWHIPR